jgi:hypothetical protein
MSELISNVNLANVNIYGNTGNVPVNLEPGIPKAVALVPKGTIKPAANLVSPTALYTYVQTASAQGFIADSRANRWFAFTDLDDFKDETKAMASIDTGLNQLDITKFNTKFAFRYLSNNANFIEALAFDNAQNFFDCFIFDSQGQIWGRVDPNGNGGLASFSLQQIRVKDAMRPTVKDINQYAISFQFKNRIQFNENFKIYNAGLDSDAILMLQNGVMKDISSIVGSALSITTTTTVVADFKAGQDSIDVFALYGSSLTAGCFTAKNLTLGTTLTISTLTVGTVVSGGQTYNYGKFVLSAAPTATNLVQISLAAPSVVNAVIPNFNIVTEIAQTGIDGANAAVHTF